MKKFFKETSVTQDDAAADSYAVLLDSRRLKTAAKRDLVLPTAALAHAIASEWDAQVEGEDIAPESMPMTAYTFTALDIVADKVDAVREEVARYAETDLLCYIADEPAELSKRLKEQWQPLLDWSATNLDAPFLVTSGLLAIAQPNESIASIRRHVDALALMDLTAVQTLTSVLGSVVLAFAVVQGRLTSVQAFNLSRIEEHFQIEQWGEDEENAIKLAEDQREVNNAAAFLNLVRVRA